MHRPAILRVVNSDHLLWLQLEPHKHTLYVIDLIVRGVDDEANGILQPKEHFSYGQFIPRKLSHHNRDGLYAISMYTRESVDLLLLKDHAMYPLVGSLVKKYFDVDDDIVQIRIDFPNGAEA